MFQRKRAEFVCNFLECLTCSNGAPFRLMNWQRNAITEFYGTYTQPEDRPVPVRQYQYLYLETPKKNGKSELAGGLGVYHLFADGEKNGEVYIVAADRDNAGIVYNVAKWMVEHSPALAKRSRIVDSTKTIIDRISGSKLKVLSSEAYSKHGYKPSCVIFDELHAQRNRDLWDVMTFGAGDAREAPVWIVLTTAGDDPDRNSIGWEIHQKALSILRYRKGDRDERARDNPRWLPIIYGLGLYGDDDEIKKINIYDEKLWKQCNPSVGQTVKLSTIRAEAEEAKTSEASERLFRWLRLNQWIAVHTVGWMPVTLYDKTEWDVKNPLEILKGKRCFGGLDLSMCNDLTAFVLLFPPQAGLSKWTALFQGWVPNSDLREREKRDHVPYGEWIKKGYLQECDGDIVDYEDIFNAVMQAARRYDLRMVGFDPALASAIMQRLTDALAGTRTQIVVIPQGMLSISPPMKEVERLVRAGEMLHVPNPAARWCFGNIRLITDSNENIKPTKKRAAGRIDMIVAWIIAFATAQLAPKPTIADVIARGNYHM